MALSWIEALKVYNAGMPSWCIPRKGTTAYDTITKLRKGEKTETPKELIDKLERKTQGKPKKEKRIVRIDLDKVVPKMTDKQEVEIPSVEKNVYITKSHSSGGAGYTSKGKGHVRYNMYRVSKDGKTAELVMKDMSTPSSVGEKPKRKSTIEVVGTIQPVSLTRKQKEFVGEKVDTKATDVYYATKSADGSYVMIYEYDEDTEKLKKVAEYEKGEYSRGGIKNAYGTSLYGETPDEIKVSGKTFKRYTDPKFMKWVKSM
jgi:hypothetical protein